MPTMKVSERFALNQWLKDYPKDLGYAEVLKLIRERTVQDITTKTFALGMTWPSIIEEIEKTRNEFEDTVDDLSPLCLSEVREPEVRKYRITRRSVETFLIDATSQEQAIDQYLAGQATVETQETMELKAELEEENT